MSKWIDMPKNPGSPEIKRILEPIPKGPFAIVPQHISDEFEEHFNEIPFTKVDKFELRWGHVTYAVGSDFRPMVCGVWLDTSD